MGKVAVAHACGAGSRKLVLFDQASLIGKIFLIKKSTVTGAGDPFHNLFLLTQGMSERCAEREPCSSTRSTTPEWVRGPDLVEEHPRNDLRRT